MANEKPAEKAAPKKTNEAKDVRFKRLAAARLGKALKAIENVGRLSNRQSYAYGANQADFVIGKLTEAVTNVETRFKTTALPVTTSIVIPD